MKGLLLKQMLSYNIYIVGKGRGFGFVEFIEVEDARAAIDNMHSRKKYII